MLPTIPHLEASFGQAKALPFHSTNYLSEAEARCPIALAVSYDLDALDVLMVFLVAPKIPNAEESNPTGNFDLEEELPEENFYAVVVEVVDSVL